MSHVTGCECFQCKGMSSVKAIEDPLHRTMCSADAYQNPATPSRAESGGLTWEEFKAEHTHFSRDEMHGAHIAWLAFSDAAASLRAELETVRAERDEMEKIILSSQPGKHIRKLQTENAALRRKLDAVRDAAQKWKQQADDDPMPTDRQIGLIDCTMRILAILDADPAG